MKGMFLAGWAMLVAAISIMAFAQSRRGDDEIQEVKVVVTKTGYEPSSFDLKPGIPARVTFVRESAESCGTEIVIPAYNVKCDLPLRQPVVVEFTPDKPGVFSFTCGMEMLRGRVVVQEK